MHSKTLVALTLAAGIAAGVAISQQPARGQLTQQLPGRNVGIVDLMKSDWKYQPGTTIDANGQIGITWPKGAQRPEFDDSGWKTVNHLPGAAEPQQPGVSCGWYRKTIELPAKIGDMEVSDARPFLVYGVDDYMETWIDGKKNIGGSGYPNMYTPWEIRGFDKPAAIDLSASPYFLKPGQSFKLAVHVLNGPLADPYGGYFFHEARIEFRK
jgi:hypothetical protein